MDDFWGKGITKPQTLLWPLSPGTDGQGQMGGGESGVEVGREKVLSIARHMASCALDLIICSL